MTTTIVYADTTDGYLRSEDTHYTDMRAGSSVTLDTADTAVYWGQSGAGVTFVGWEAFLSFTYSPDATQTVTAANFRLRSVSNLTTSVSRSLDVAEYDWGASLGTDDWRDGTWLASAASVGPLMAVDEAQDAGTKYYIGGSIDLVERLAAASPLRVVAFSHRLAGGYTPGDTEQSSFRSSDQSGTSDDPAIVYSSVPNSVHLHCAGAQARLSDGSWVYLNSNGSTPTPTITLRRHTSAGATTDLATIPLGTSSTDFQITPGLQSLALIVDQLDNIYVVGTKGSDEGSIAARAYIKGAGLTWTAGTIRSAAMPVAYGAAINNVAGVWRDKGTYGSLVVVAARTTCWWNSAPTTDVVYALVNCEYLLTGTGSLLRNSGVAVGTLVDQATSATNFGLPCNETGTGLDVTTAPGDITRGYVLCYSGAGRLGDNHLFSVWRYIVATGGVSLSSTLGMGSQYGVKDANSKVRVVGIGSSVVVGVSIDSTTGVGPTFNILQNVGTSTTYTSLGTVTLGGEGMTSLPTAATLASSAAWDVYYDSVDNKLWFYYIDASNARTVRRTAIDMNTYQPTREEIQVDTNIGTGAASVCRSIRVERNNVAGNQILVTYAIDTSGVQSVDTVVDSLNKAPTQPTLTPEPNFDATAACTLEWAFNDPNVGDTQGAYQLQIYDTADNSLAYDSAKVNSATPAYVGAGAVAAGNNATLTPAIHASSQAGDTIVVFASIRNSGTGTPNCPSGYITLVSFANTALFGKVHSGSESAPSVSFTGGAANADTLAQTITLRNVPLNVVASATQLNGSAANIAYPALTVPVNNCFVLVCGWKQDDYTSVAALAGMTEIAENSSTAGDDASQIWDYVQQTTKANIVAGSFTVTGGASAISRGLTVALGPAGSSPTTASHSLPANTLDNTKSYRWRVRTYDAALAEGPWSGYSTFSCAAGGNVTVTDPASDNPAGVINDHYTVAWSVSGTTQASYRVVVVRTDTSAELVNTGWVASTDTTYLVNGMLSDVEYRVQVTVRNVGLVESGTGTRLITPDYNTPDQPVAVATAFDGAIELSPYVGGYVEVAVTNPSPSGDRPTAASNQILRRVTGTTDWTAVGVAVAGTYRDYAAAHGVSYDYAARAVAADGSYNDSAAVAASLTLRGVWIHDPLDPAATVKRYFFGKANRSTKIDVTQAEQVYAGRTLPVVDFGDPQAESYSIGIYLPFGTDEYGNNWATDTATLRAFNTLRRTLCLRDNRGRRVFGVMSGYNERDEDTGTSVTFTFTAVDYDEDVG